SESGLAIATYRVLRERLCVIARVPDDPTADLERLWSLALSKDASAAREVLLDALTMKPNASRDIARAIVSLPFYELYDLTLTNVLETAIDPMKLARSVTVRNILDDFPLARAAGERTLLKVHGTAAAPSLRWPQSADRLSPPAAWFGRIGDILASRP